MKTKIINIIKKILTPAMRKKIFVFVQNTFLFVFGHMPIKNRVLFFTIRANGKLLDNAKAVYDALDADKVVFARLQEIIFLKKMLYFFFIHSRLPPQKKLHNKAR